MIEIEVGNGMNSDLFFLPIGKRVRGFFDPRKVLLADTGDLHRDFPRGVPGQRIVFDPDKGVGAIVEPLQSEANADVREAILRRASAGSAYPVQVEFAPALSTYPTAHAPTWIGWMARAVHTGSAKLVRGKLPETDPPEMRRSFFSVPKTDPKDALITQLVALVTASLPPDKQKAVAAMVAAAK